MDAIEIADRLALENLVSRYCRAIDRHDWPTLRDLYHSDSFDDHGDFYTGNGQGFADAASSKLVLYERHMHSVLNSLFVVDGASAEGEAYFFAVVQTPLPDAKSYQFGGRYLDRFEKRNGVWRFLRRVVVHDWLMELPLSEETCLLLDSMGVLGDRGASDPSYSLAPMLSAKYMTDGDKSQ